jgi:hypothetical protein
MPNTYVALATQTLGTAASSVTFSLIPSGYTDLVLVVNGKLTSGAASFNIQFNSDTASNYSATVLYGDGTSAGSVRGSNVTYGNIGTVGAEFGTTIINVMNYANTTTNKTAISSFKMTSSAYGETGAKVALWRSTSAINSVTIFVATSTFTAGSTFSLYGIANADQGSAKATGGIITEDSQYWYHTFGASGAFIPKQSLTCDVLVVAGGGGGGNNGGGGGGAGGLRYFASQSVTAISYNVTIGAGGGTATSGVNSSFGALTAATGGGNGGSLIAGGAAGGSGGGGGAGYNFGGGPVAPGAGGAASPSGQGNAGGGGYALATSTPAAIRGGGGGGAGSAGTAATDSIAGTGGAGSLTYSSWGLVTGTGQNILGTVYYAGAGGGGGGTNYPTSAGGAGGGGTGGNGSNESTAGSANTGGGGGGGGNPGTLQGGAGGSGIVVIRYAK